ncbi:MAG: ribokinase [Brevinema sp.]
MKKVLVAGSINMDLVVGVDRFPNPGETLLGLHYNEYIGGKGANQASGAILQGVSTTLWGFMGEDAHAKKINTAAKALGINLIIHQSKHHTGLAMIEVSKEGQNRIVVVPGANYDFTVDEAKKHWDIIQNHDIIVLQHEIPLDTNLFIAQKAKDLGKTVILNPAPAMDIDQSIFKSIDYLIPNEHELSLLTGINTDSDEGILNGMLHLSGKGVKCIITTLGARGACYLEGDKMQFLVAPKVKAIDTTGAGDAFIGSFAAYLAKGLTLEQAIQHALIAASIGVTRVGAFGSAGSETEVEGVINEKK